MGAAALSAATPVLFDSVVLALTLHKCAGTVRCGGGPSKLLSRHLLEDGLVYYVIVFASNLVSDSLFKVNGRNPTKHFPLHRRLRL